MKLPEGDKIGGTIVIVYVAMIAGQFNPFKLVSGESPLAFGFLATGTAILLIWMWRRPPK